MDNHSKTIIGAIALVLFLVGSLFINLTQEQYAHIKMFDETHNELEQQYNIMNGIIESPAVIIIVDTFSEFVEMADEIGADIIYQYGYSFYVFEEGYTRAWKYTPLIEKISGNLLFPEWGRAN